MKKIRFTAWTKTVLANCSHLALSVAERRGLKWSCLSAVSMAAIRRRLPLSANVGSPMCPARRSACPLPVWPLRNVPLLIK